MSEYQREDHISHSGNCRSRSEKDEACKPKCHGRKHAKREIQGKCGTPVRYNPLSPSRFCHSPYPLAILKRSRVKRVCGGASRRPTCTARLPAALGVRDEPPAPRGQRANRYTHECCASIRPSCTGTDLATGEPAPLGQRPNAPEAPAPLGRARLTFRERPVYLPGCDLSPDLLGLVLCFSSLIQCPIAQEMSMSSFFLKKTVPCTRYEEVKTTHN